MAVLQFNYPTTILFGPGAVAEFAKRLAPEHQGRRFLIVTDPGGVAAGLADRVRTALEEAGLSVEVFDGVHPNPAAADVVGGAKLFRPGRVEGSVAMGAGSPQDR